MHGIMGRMWLQQREGRGLRAEPEGPILPRGRGGLLKTREQSDWAGEWITKCGRYNRVNMMPYEQPDDVWTK